MRFPGDAPGLVLLRRELQEPGPDENPAYRELSRGEAGRLVKLVAAIEPRLHRVLAEIVRQADASPYTDGWPATRLLPLLAGLVSAGEGL